MIWQTKWKLQPARAKFTGVLPAYVLLALTDHDCELNDPARPAI